jgi:serine/threonine protein kinase
MIGRTILHYKILAEIGEGGMGVVYKAEDTRLDRLVALKFLPADLSADPERLQRLEQEAKAVAALNHPNIVTLHSFESAEVEGQGEVHFLTMELVEGKSLAALIPAGGLSLEKLLEIGVPLAEAVAVAHRKGITHRDLKPANVMVTSSGRVKVLDFGLAKARVDTGTVEATALATERAMTEEGRVLGTVPYMSPEQLQGKPLDPRSDIFALGIILYEMSTGDRPFAGDTSADVMSAILRDVPQAATELRRDMPRHLGRVIRRCLEKDPERRYQSAIDVRNELEDVKKDLATTDGLGGLPSPSPKVPRRRGQRRWGRYVIAAGGVAAVTLAVFVAMSLSDFRERLTGSAGSPQIRSLAVLPFDNLMNDPEQDYFVDGIHEELITDLAKIGALRVTSRTSVMRYRDTEKSMPDIAAELGVDGLVEGSVLRVGDEVRIRAQLVHGPSDSNLWADSYDRSLENVLVLLSDVALAIADEIEIALTPQQEASLAGAGQVDPEAYEAYLRGFQTIQYFSREGLRRGTEQFRRSIEIDPDFAKGYAGLAFALAAAAAFEWIPVSENIDEMSALAERALELDPENAEAHVVLGYIDLWFDWDWDGAEQEFLQALERQPNQSFARHGYADALLVKGLPEESLQQVKLGRESDPFSPLVNLPILGHLLMLRRYDEIIREYEVMRDLGILADGGFIADALWFQGKQDEAVARYRQDFERFGSSAHVEALDRGGAEAGPVGAVRAVADLESERAASNNDLGAFGVARWYARAGATEEALEWIERAYAARSPLLFLVIAYPAFDILRSEPRYLDMVERMGLPPSVVN